MITKLFQRIRVASALAKWKQIKWKLGVKVCEGVEGGEREDKGSSLRLELMLLISTVDLSVVMMLLDH